MKKYLVLLLAVLTPLFAGAQGRGLKIAYIDMEYILDKVPDYAEAKNQLEQRASKWKQEMDVKRNEITKLKESLQAEKALLTKELIEEREEEIALLEKELIDYQEQKFGPKGELITQKAVLVKPIQDQVFNIIQDLASADARKYDFVFDRSSDLTILFAAKKHDISDLIVKRLTRSARQQKLNSKDVKKLEEQEKKEELESDPDYVDRQKALEDKKAARQKIIDDRKAASDAKRQAAQEKRDQLLKDREAARNGAKAKTTDTATDDNTPDTAKKAATPAKSQDTDAEEAQDKTATETGRKSAEEIKANRAAEVEAAKQAREEKLEQRRQALEQRRLDAQEKREAANKARAEKKAENEKATDPTTGDDEDPADGN